MKRLFILFALSLWICAGMAALCTACAADKEEISASVSSSTELKSSNPEIKPTAEPLETDNMDIAENESNSTIKEPDLRGTVQDVQQTSFTIVPISVTASGHDAAAGASQTDALSVDISEATIETVRIYNGGNDAPQPSDMSALQAGKSVYLYGIQSEENFLAERVLILEAGDESE